MGDYVNIMISLPIYPPISCEYLKGCIYGLLALHCINKYIHSQLETCNAQSKKILIGKIAKNKSHLLFCTPRIRGWVGILMENQNGMQ